MPQPIEMPGVEGVLAVPAGAVHEPVDLVMAPVDEQGTVGVAAAQSQRTGPLHSAVLEEAGGASGVEGANNGIPSREVDPPWAGVEEALDDVLDLELQLRS